MHVLKRNGYRVEAGAVREPDGFYCVTAELFDGKKMVRGFYRRMRPDAGLHEAERDLAEDMACMSTQAE